VIALRGSRQRLRHYSRAEGGLDVFLAGRKVGPSGKAIGIDMTPEMLELVKTHLL